MIRSTADAPTSSDIRQADPEGSIGVLHSTACPNIAISRKLLVLTVAKEIRTPKRTLYPGNFILVDTKAEPAEGKMVLVGNRLELWSGQPDIDGVHIGTWIDDEGTEGGAS